MFSNWKSKLFGFLAAIGTGWATLHIPLPGVISWLPGVLGLLGLVGLGGTGTDATGGTLTNATHVNTSTTHTTTIVPPAGTTAPTRTPIA
jgi:hypothetical protein